MKIAWPRACAAGIRRYAGAVLPGASDTTTERSLVVVAGSGRSGTSLFTGILQRLGFHVPQPEVPADATNPRGFAESQWVVAFHARLLRAARVQVSDARPAAWALTAQVGLDPAVRRELRGWLARELVAGHVIVKDPRLSWFLPLWRSCAEDLGVAPRFVTMLRHPAAVIDSKQRWYGEWQGDVARAAGWAQQTLFTERATRDSPRAFVRYDDLLDDWTRTVARVGESLDLALVRDAPAGAMRDVHGFVDRGLSRSRADWGDLKLPAALRAQVDEVWSVVSALAGPGDDAGRVAAVAGGDTERLAAVAGGDTERLAAAAGGDTERLAAAAGGDTERLAAVAGGVSADPTARLDALRAAYVDLYAEAEAIAQSSIAAAAKGRAVAPVARVPAPALRLVRRVPRRYRHSVPPAWRGRIARVLARSA